MEIVLGGKKKKVTVITLLHEGDPCHCRVFLPFSSVRSDFPSHSNAHAIKMKKEKQ